LYIETVLMTRKIFREVSCLALQKDLQGIRICCSINGMDLNAAECAFMSCTRSHAALRYDYSLSEKPLQRFNRIVTELTNATLNIIGNWCDGMGLCVNSALAAVVVLTRGRQLEGIGPFSLRDSSIELKSEVKYIIKDIICMTPVNLQESLESQVKGPSTKRTPARALTALPSQSPSIPTPMAGTYSPPRNGNENERVAENIRVDLSSTVLDEVGGGVVHDEVSLAVSYITISKANLPLSLCPTEQFSSESYQYTDKSRLCRPIVQ
ncbi:hypothetical protein J6590_097517, partial [Homalodisca vitripennis]